MYIEQLTIVNNFHCIVYVQQRDLFQVLQQKCSSHSWAYINKSCFFEFGKNIANDNWIGLYARCHEIPSTKRGA